MTLSKILAVGKKYKHSEDNEEKKPCLNKSKMDMNGENTERTPSENGVTLNIPEFDKNEIQESNQQQKQYSKRTSYFVKNAFDVIIFIIVCITIVLIECRIIPGARLGFTCRDPTISYPFFGDSISTATIFIVAIFGPLLLILFIEILNKRFYKRICASTIWYYYKKSIIGLTLTILLTEIVKVFIAEPRPHFFDTCKPDANQYCQPGTFIMDYSCTNQASNQLHWDVERSFPSAHASISMFISIYCAYLVQSRLQGNITTEVSKLLLIVGCLLFTCLCCFTRITDRRHHWWDVLAGAILGLFGAFYTIYLINKNENNRNNLIRSKSSSRMLDMENKNSNNLLVWNK